MLVLEHSEKPGGKILISGGGRCNFTNIHTAPDRFFSANPHFCKSALSRYTPRDFLALVEKHQIAWHEKTLGQLFCDVSAKLILAMLLDECAAAGVEVRVGQRVRTTLPLPLREGEGGRGCQAQTPAGLHPSPHPPPATGGGEYAVPPRFQIETDAGTIQAESIVLATGGLSIPKMGATGLSHDIARQFGLALTETRPGLVPLTLPAGVLARTQALSGVALEVVARIGRKSFREALLFTHRGLSGPAILQISSVWRPGDVLTIDLLPDLGPDFLIARKRARPKASLRTLLHEALPQRAADLFAPEAIAARPMADIQDKALLALGASLKAWQVTPSGTEGYAKAEVTLGGIDTDGLSSRTMEAKSVPGLFVIGEAMDVTGWLGGYNFQWAWASGHSAGLTA